MTRCWGLWTCPQGGLSDSAWSNSDEAVGKNWMTAWRVNRARTKQVKCQNQRARDQRHEMERVAASAPCRGLAMVGGGEVVEKGAYKQRTN